MAAQCCSLCLAPERHTNVSRPLFHSATAASNTTITELSTICARTALHQQNSGIALLSCWVLISLKLQCPKAVSSQALPTFGLADAAWQPAPNAILPLGCPNAGWLLQDSLPQRKYETSPTLSAVQKWRVVKGVRTR